MVSVPPVESAALVSSRATVALERMAASLVPLMVTCTLVSVPSAAATEKVSETEAPTFRLSKALLAVKLQAPALSMLKVPWAPTVPVCATKVAALSTSLMVSAPLVVSAASVSSSATTSADRTAASLVPCRVTVTTCVVPSAVVTVMWSVSVPPLLSSCTEALALLSV